jgi:hypothetical protein
VFIFMMTDLLLQSKSSVWSWPIIVVLLFIISSLVLFWGPIRRLINEWRLYRRCQKYPHIVVCKKQETSKKNQKQLMTLRRHLRAKMARIANNVIKDWLLPIVVFLFAALGKIFGLIFNRFLVVLTFKKSSTSTDGIEIPSTTQPVRAKGEQREEEVSTTTESLHGVKENLRESTSSLPVHGTARKKLTRISPKTTKYYYNIQGQSTDLYETSESSSTTEDIKHAKNKKSHDLPSKQSSYSKSYTKTSPPQQQQQSLDISRGKNLTRISGPSKRKFSSPIMAATTTALPTAAMCIDSTTSLSDQVRKRRLNGEHIGVVVESRKKRRLNSSRTSVFQGVARRQTGSFWQSRKPLDKREREEREERLLRGMNRSKRIKSNDKPIIDNPKLVTGTESTDPPATNQFTVAAAPTTAAASGPTFNFGQADAKASDKQGTEITAATSAPAPAVTDQLTAAAPTPAAASAPTFNFGQAGANTSEEKQAAPALASKPSTAPLQFGAPQRLEAVKDSTVTNSQPVANTVAAPTVVNQQPSFAFGSGSTPASAGALAPTAVSTQVQFGDAGQGNNSVPTSQQLAPAQGITFGAPAPTAVSTQVQFGATGQGNIPSQGITFGAPAPAPAPTAGLTQNQFGSAGQFNSAASSQQSGNQFGAASANQSFSGFTPPPAPAAISQQSVTQGFNQNSFGGQTSLENTKENTNPGMVNSTFQQSSTASNGNMPTASNGFSKPDPTNGNNNAPPFGMNAPAPPSFGAGIGGPVATFGAGAGGPAASSGASARRQQRRSRTRRR